jgi:hypothetical protein
MISHELSQLANSFRKFTRDGMQMEPDGVAALVELLDMLAVQARHVEFGIVPEIGQPAPPWGWGDPAPASGGQS